MPYDAYRLQGALLKGATRAEEAVDKFSEKFYLPQFEQQVGERLRSLPPEMRARLAELHPAEWKAVAKRYLKEVE